MPSQASPQAAAAARSRERVTRILDEVCAKTGVARPTYVSAGERHQASYNPWNNRLKVSDTFAAKLSDRSLAAVIAHEIGHARRRPALLSQTGVFALMVVAVVAAFLSAPYNSATVVQLLFAAVAMATLCNWAGLLEEFAADEFAVRYTGDVAGYMRVFQHTFALAGQEPGESYMKRIRRLRELEQDVTPRRPPQNPPTA